MPVPLYTCTHYDWIWSNSDDFYFKLIKEINGEKSVKRIIDDMKKVLEENKIEPDFVLKFLSKMLQYNLIEIVLLNI